MKCVQRSVATGLAVVMLFPQYFIINKTFSTRNVNALLSFMLWSADNDGEEGIEARPVQAQLGLWQRCCTC